MPPNGPGPMQSPYNSSNYYTHTHTSLLDQTHPGPGSTSHSPSLDFSSGSRPSTATSQSSLGTTTCTPAGLIHPGGPSSNPSPEPLLHQQQPHSMRNSLLYDGPWPSSSNSGSTTGHQSQSQSPACGNSGGLLQPKVELTPSPPLHSIPHYRTDAYGPGSHAQIGAPNDPSSTGQHPGLHWQ